MKSIFTKLAVLLAVPFLAFMTTSCGDDHDHADETEKEHKEHS